MIDMHVVNKKAKKVHRFTIQKKKVINVHTVNWKKQRKYIDFYVHAVNKKSKDST